MSDDSSLGRWSFDDYFIGQLRPDGQSLRSRVLRRVEGLSHDEWYKVAGAICRRFNANASTEDQKASKWQPIETAPQDDLVLLSCVGWPAAAAKGAPWPVKIGGWWAGGWNIFGASWEPTHWMPLPAPPS